eukprot:TRINITY_DN50590_c0_g1_i1.p1 TRINITY_DN50590_c0_g1~~TRINITY_DN50590_c0_g1_i1.p1  ORF type:complete len:112 (-),score=20.92 TRINITY_DN50590_c0_g1_i1:370-705(-)
MVVFLASVIFEVAEDGLSKVLLALWDPRPAGCAKRMQQLDPLHPKQAEGAHMEIERMHQAGVHFVVGTALVWTTLALSVVVGLDHLLACAHDETELDVVPMLFVWQNNTCT